MKRARRVLVWSTVATVLLIIALLMYTTAKGRLIWFRSLEGVVITEDGKAVSGSLHRSASGEVLIATRRLPQRTESYWIILPGVKPGRVVSCGEWSAPALPLFFISNLKPPCFLPIEERPVSKPYGGPTDRQLMVGSSTLTFTADDGRRLQASWR